MIRNAPTQITRNDMVTAMVFAALHTDGKDDFTKLSSEEIKSYVDSAVADLKLAEDAAEPPK